MSAFGTGLRALRCYVEVGGALQRLLRRAAGGAALQSCSACVVNNAACRPRARPPSPTAANFERDWTTDTQYDACGRTCRMCSASDFGLGHAIACGRQRPPRSMMHAASLPQVGGHKTAKASGWVAAVDGQAASNSGPRRAAAWGWQAATGRRAGGGRARGGRGGLQAAAVDGLRRPPGLRPLHGLRPAHRLMACGHRMACAHRVACAHHMARMACTHDTPAAWLAPTAWPAPTA